MLRILHIFHEMNNGGIEHFVMDYYRNIDRSQVQFDFLTSVERNGYFDEEIRSLGGRIFKAYPLKKNPILNFLEISKIVRENNYEIVHRHTGSAFGYFDLRAAKHGGAKHLILHSHNNNAGNPLLHNISNLVLKLPCIRMACSQEAGEWLFGKNSPFKIINNAIDCSKFSFHNTTRQQTRAALDVEDKFVIGHIGRFEPQKNHLRLLQIFKSVLQKDKNCVLICVGTGSSLETCQKYATDLGITNHIQFLGNRADVPTLMQAFDIFTLPSLYEGFPFVLVEAQTCGLLCLASNHVPEEINITGNVRFLPLEATDDMWSNAILSLKQKTYSREPFSEFMKASGFDIHSNAAQLCAYYMSLE